MGGLYDAATLRALMCKVRAVCGFADLPSRRIQNARCVFREKEGNEDLPTGMKGIRLFREWFGCKMNIRQSPAKTMCQFAVSEDRTHDLRIMRPTRYQLRYCHCANLGQPPHGPSPHECCKARTCLGVFGVAQPWWCNEVGRLYAASHDSSSAPSSSA